MNRPLGIKTTIVLLGLGMLLPAWADPELSLLPRGYAISPAGFPDVFDDPEALPGAMDDFLDELDRLPQPVLMWNGAWREDLEGGSDSGEIPEAAIFVQAIAIERGLIPVAVFGWRRGANLLLATPNDPTNDWSNTESPALYVQMLADYAFENSPVIMLLGNENDFYYAQDSVDYSRWIDVYNDAYDAIKSVSEDTLVGPVFNFEHLSGTGGLNDWTDPKWLALDQHDLARIDIVAVTMYPWLEYEVPELVPGNHLQSLLDRIADTPILITETAWPAGDPGSLEPAWETTPSAQVRYLARLEAIVIAAGVEGLLWPFLHQPTELGTVLDWNLFASTSFFDEQGDARPAYAHWLLLLDRLFADQFE